MLPVSLKVEHHVHHVLEHARARNRALFGHMADEEHRAARRLGHAHQQAGTFAHLRNAAGRAGHVRAVHRLDRVDNHVIRRDFLPAALGRIHRVFAEDEQIVARHAQPPRAHLDLSHGFLAGDIQHARAAPRQMLRRLQQERRFADAGVAAHQHQRPFHHAAAEHAIQFADARRRAGARLLGDFGKAHGACARSRPLLVRLHGDCRLLRGLRSLLLERIPRIAAGAFAHPARRFIAAGAAHKHRLFLRHDVPPSIVFPLIVSHLAAPAKRGENFFRFARFPD